MNRTYAQTAFAVLAVALLTLNASEVLAQASGTVDFSKVDKVGTGFITWLKGNIAIAIFTGAFIICGFMAAMNRISWWWVVMIFVGGFFVFGGSSLVTQMKSALT
ncbi:TrbC/VirB2 family protein [Paracoccus sp. (in: a-proteobacteria)]|uniref:TrbC/VirB2 family protein n=1 Tax=Paracoccus sp. TaxID=267 RepID=UPI0028A2879D|nr:TrbC/VirB2 family protein [Paracoccus sp. (in: a-proteobacteria)]